MLPTSTLPLSPFHASVTLGTVLASVVGVALVVLVVGHLVHRHRPAAPEIAPAAPADVAPEDDATAAGAPPIRFSA